MSTTQSEEFSEQRIADLFAEFEDSIEDPEEEPTEEPIEESAEEPAEEEVDETTEEEAEAPTEEEPEDEEEETSDEEAPAEEEAPTEGDHSEEQKNEGNAPTEPDKMSAFDRQSAADLAEIRVAFPEQAPMRLDEMEGYGYFIGLRLAGFSAVESFELLQKRNAANRAEEKKPAPTDATMLPEDLPTATRTQPTGPTKGHLTSVAPRPVGGTKGMTREEMRAAREIFPGLSDREISALHRKVNK